MNTDLLLIQIKVIRWELECAELTPYERIALQDKLIDMLMQVIRDSN